MPCICDGGLSGEEAYDEFIRSDKGKEALENIIRASSIIMAHDLQEEGRNRHNVFEFRQMFVKCFLHMMVGCDEIGRTKAN